MPRYVIWIKKISESYAATEVQADSLEEVRKIAVELREAGDTLAFDDQQNTDTYEIDCVEED